MLEQEPLKAADVAQILQVGKNMVYQLAKTGELPSYHIGRKLRFTMRDVETYLNSVRQEHAAAVDASNKAPAVLSSAVQEGTQGQVIVLAGGDIAGDIFANYLSQEYPAVTRSYTSAYAALVDLYMGSATAALVNLYDFKTNSYNIPYVQRIAPGTSVVVVRLAKRRVGYIVAAGNPKKLTSWGALLREGVRIANRPRGEGARVLLDQKLISMEARASNIAGYDDDSASLAETLARVAYGQADVCVGSEMEASRQAGLQFVAMQEEQLDIVVRKTEESRKVVRAIKELAASDSLKSVFAGFEGYKTDNMGAIVYEC